MGLNKPKDPGEGSEGVLRWLLEAKKEKLTLVNILSVLALPLIGGGWKLYGAGWRGTGLLAMALGGLSVVYVGYRRFTGPADTSKLKGPNPFTYSEGAQLAKLCRSHVLAELNDAISTGNVSAIFLIGPNGVGKTSLVSGLRNMLVQKAVDPDPRFIHIDGNASDLGDDLLTKVNSRLGEKQAKFASIEAVMRSEDAELQVIVVDDAHLAENSGELRQWVKWASEKVGTRGRKLVLILDSKKHQESWVGVDLGNSQLFRYITLDRFDDSNAKAVARALASTANFRLRKRLLDELVAGACIPVEVPQARVSPLALSVLVKQIAEKPSGLLGFGLKEYRDAGYSAGLLAEFIVRRLGEVYPDTGRSICDAIAHCVPLASDSQPWATRFKVDDLGLDPDIRVELKNALNYLSSPAVHILRIDRNAGEFVVLDEWVPAFRALLGGATERRLACLSDYLVKKQKFWNAWPLSAKRSSERDGNNDYLLPSREVSEIEGALPQLLSGSGVLQDYVAASKKHNRKRAIRRSATVIAIVGTVVGLLFYNPPRMWRGRNIEPSHRLPSDFDEYSAQLSDLSVVCMLEDLKDLPRGLASLDLDCSEISSLHGVPPNVVRLGLSLTNVENLQDAPESLRDLDFSGNSSRKVDGISLLNLSSLNLGLVPISDLNLLPRSLASLRLSDPHLVKLDGLPPNLQELVLLGTGVQSLRGIPDRIRSLTLVDNFQMKGIDYLPAHLVSLRTQALPRDPAIIPSSLETLALETGSDVSNLPGIKNLELTNTKFTGILSECLTSLKLNDQSSSEPFLPKPAGQVRLPDRLRFLKIRLSDGAQFSILPKNLQGLDLERSLGLESLSGLDIRISELNITNTGIADLTSVPPSVLVLRFELCRAKDLAQFPPELEELYLGGCSELRDIENLPQGLLKLDVHGTALSGLPKLPASLKSLDISNSMISGHLPSLPSGLEELTLHAGQVDTLKGLPKTVKKLHFRARSPNSETTQAAANRPGS